MTSYLEKLVVCRFSFQLLAVGDCLLELGGLDDHDCGVCSLSLDYPWVQVLDLLSWSCEAVLSQEGSCGCPFDNGME